MTNEAPVRKLSIPRVLAGAFAIAWQRRGVVIKGLALPGAAGWGRRETRFLVWIVVIYVMIMAATLAALTVAGFFVANFSTALFESIQGYISAAIGTYVFARFTLVLPATAIDSHTSLPRVWRQTRGSNGWRMVVIVGALPWTFGYALSFLYGEDPGSGRMALVTALGTALLVVEIAAISLSYRELDEPSAPEPAER